MAKNKEVRIVDPNLVEGLEKDLFSSRGNRFLCRQRWG